MSSVASLTMCGIRTELLLLLPLCSHGEGSNKNEDANRRPNQGDRISHDVWHGGSSTCSEGLCLRLRSALIVTQSMVRGRACASSTVYCSMCGMSTELVLLLALCSHGEGLDKDEDASRGPIQGDRIAHAAWDGASSMCSGGLCLAAQRVHCDAEYCRR